MDYIVLAVLFKFKNINETKQNKQTKEREEEKVIILTPELADGKLLVSF